VSIFVPILSVFDGVALYYSLKLSIVIPSALLLVPAEVISWKSLRSLAISSSLRAW
jgi:hypothetical protein